MFMKTRLATFILLGIAVLPARAQTETTQSGSQGAVIAGDNNQVTQVINQTIINHPGRGSINRAKDKNHKGENQSINNRGNNQDRARKVKR
jgi:hypothetical protein